MIHEAFWSPSAFMIHKAGARLHFLIKRETPPGACRFGGILVSIKRPIIDERFSLLGSRTLGKVAVALLYTRAFPDDILVSASAKTARWLACMDGILVFRIFTVFLHSFPFVIASILRPALYVGARRYKKKSDMDVNFFLDSSAVVARFGSVVLGVGDGWVSW